MWTRLNVIMMTIYMDFGTSTFWKSKVTMRRRKWERTFQRPIVKCVCYIFSSNSSELVQTGGANLSISIRQQPNQTLCVTTLTLCTPFLHPHTFYSPCQPSTQTHATIRIFLIIRKYKNNFRFLINNY